MESTSQLSYFPKHSFIEKSNCIQQIWLHTLIMLNKILTHIHILFVVCIHNCEYILRSSTTSSFLAYFANYLHPHMFAKSIITPMFVRPSMLDWRIQSVSFKQKKLPPQKKKKKITFFFWKEMKKMMMIVMMKQNKLQPFSNLKAFHVNDKPSLWDSSDIQHSCFERKGEK
jgi:hypothetical protein